MTVRKRNKVKASRTTSDATERKEAEESRRESQWFLQSTLDGLSAHIAVLDDQGEIILTNKAYRDFAERNGIDPVAVSEGANYLAVCDTASGEHSDEAGPFAVGIRDVLSGKRQSFELEYPCHSPDEKRWFIGRITPFTGEGPRRVVIAHENITERKRAETKLKESEERFRRVIDTADEYIYEIDEYGRIKFLSERVKVILGYAPEELIGKTPFDTIASAEEVERVRGLFAEYVRNRRPFYQMEHLCLTKDGQLRTLSVSGMPIFDKKDALIGYQGAVEDITERKRSEQLLKESEYQFRAFIEQSPLAIGVFTLEGISLYANIKYIEIFGMKSIEDFVGRPAYEYFAPQFREESKERTRRRLLGLPVPSEYESIAVHADGSEFPVHLAISSIVLADKTVSIAFLTDITERKRAEELLRHSEEKYRVLFNTFPLGIVVSDRAGAIVESNAASEKLLGISKEEQEERRIDGDEWRIIRSDGTPMPADEYASVRALQENRLVENVEMGIVKPDAEITWINVTAAPLNLEEHSVVVTYGDVTARKRVEQALREQRDFSESLIKTAQTIILVLDTQGRIIQFNPYMEKLVGYDLDEVKGKSWFETFLNIENSDTVRSVFRNAINDNPTSGNVNPIIAKDGRTIIVEWHNTSLKDQDGCTVGILAIGQDITERKRIEEAQSFLLSFGSPGTGENNFEALARFLAINLGMNYVCIDQLNGDGLNAQTVAIYNDGKFDTNVTYALKDTPCGDVVGKTICCFPRDVCALFPNDAALQDLKSESYIGTTLWSYDGKPIGLIALISRKPMANRILAEAILKLVAVRAASELERMQAEEALREGRQRLDFAMEAGGLGVWDWNPLTGDVVYSDLWDQILEYRPDEVEPTVDFFSRHIHPEDKAAVFDQLTGHIEGRLPIFDSEHRMRTKSGKFLWVMGRGKIFERSKDGSPVRVTGIMADITERKQAEDENRKFRTIADNAVYGKAIADLQGNILYMNRFFAHIHGYEPGEIIGKHLSICHRREQMEAVDRLLASLMREGHFTPTTCWHRHKDGTDFPMLMSGVLIKDDYGNPECIAASAVDMTAYHQAAEKLEKSEELLSRAQEIAHIGSWKLDLTTKRLTWAEEVYRIFGYEPQEFTATYEAFLDVVHPDDRAAVDEEYSRSQREGSDGYEIEHRIVRRNSGEVRHVHERCVHERDAAGAIVQSTGMVQDITERKQVEEAVRQSEEKFRSIFTSMTEVVVLHELVCDEDDRPVNYRILDCNPAFTQITGIRCEDAMGRLATDVYGLDSAPYLDEYARVALTGEPCSFITAYAPMGKHFEIHVASPGKDMFVTITTDITERKRAEAEREKLQTQLLQAQKMESVGRLAGGVAHDFNNALTVILMEAEMALMSLNPSEPLYTSLEAIQKAGKRSADLTAQLLAFARKQVIAPKVLDLNKTVESMLAMLRRLIGEDIDLSWNPTSDIGKVTMDPSQLDQILTNLCVNARDAITNVGKITIETDNCAFDEEYCARNTGFASGEYAMLAVSDNGCGMEQATLASIFEPFFTTKEFGKGTGLGLSMVYGIVKQNNGFIKVYSEPGHGTTFRIYLPRHTSKVAHADSTRTPEALVGGLETILLVEDEPTILSIVKIFLERLGYSVITAETPKEAIRLANEHDGPINLLITDVVMPEMNGRDLAATLLSLYPGLKRMFMSGYTANVIAHHGVLDTGVYFIQKPFSMKEFATKVREALEK